MTGLSEVGILACRRSLLAILALSIVGGGALGQTGGDYELTWSTIDGGGGMSSGGDYVLMGTIGQPDAGRVMEGGEFTLNGGFWAGSFGCVVNLTDLALFCSQWLDTGIGLAADLDESLNVDLIDFSIFALWWLEVCPGDWPFK